jgi:lysozyme family protein
MTFDEVIKPLLAREGGYVNHPDDRGGATNFGITQAVFTEWLARQGKTWRDVKTLTEDEASRMYFTQYWLPAHCQEVPPGLRDLHFDAAVNHGVARAVRMLQEAAGVTPDGVVGPKTKAAMTVISPELLKARYVSIRYRFYGRIIKRDRSQLSFITGWLSRMEEFVS